MFLELTPACVLSGNTALYLSLLSDSSPLQVLVEAAQHMIGCRSHFWVVAAQSHHCYSQGVAGYKLEAVNHTLCHTDRGEGATVIKQK